MHGITSLELLRTLCSVCAKKSNEQISSPHMLTIFFLSEINFVNAILGVKLELMKYISFS